MPAATTQTVKLKSTLRLLITRLRNAQKKDTALSIASRREMADLLSQHREASARIRVENIIHADITVELMEILELYSELLLARAGLLDVRDKNIKEGTQTASEDTGLEEAAASIIYSAPRLPRDVRELAIVRNMLLDRFGKEFAFKATENKDDIVPVRVTEKLKVDPPSAKLVQAYLEEIARTYGVDWPKHKETAELEDLRRDVEDDDDEDGVGGGQKEPPILADGGVAAPETPKPSHRLDLGDLKNTTPPSSMQPKGAKSPISVAPPGARSDNPSPKVRLPDGQAVGKTSSKSTTSNVPAQSKNAVPGAVPSIDDLQKRFTDLRR